MSFTWHSFDPGPSVEPSFVSGDGSFDVIADVDQLLHQLSPLDKFRSQLPPTTCRQSTAIRKSRKPQFSFADFYQFQLWLQRAMRETTSSKP